MWKWKVGHIITRNRICVIAYPATQNTDVWGNFEIT